MNTQRDPFIVFSIFNPWFVIKPLEGRLKMSYGSLSPWSHSVKEAKVYQDFSMLHCRKPPREPNTITTIEASSRNRANGR
jgi:hypothetical protein